MTRPATLRIGHLTYRVIPLPDKERETCSGYCDTKTQVIAIDVTRPLARQLEVMIHEIGHAIWDALQLPPCEVGEERLVSVMAAGWTQVYQSNPALLRWISAASRATLPRLPKARK